VGKVMSYSVAGSEIPSAMASLGERYVRLTT